MTAPLRVQILLVEDDPGMVILAADRLAQSEGWQVTTAQSAADCRARLAEQPFDVILLDRSLPDCDGALLIGELLTALPDVAIVMLTSADSAASATETLKLGAWDYIVKQPDLTHLDELPTVIGRCVEQRRWRRNEARLRNEMDLLLTAIRSTGDAVVMTDCEQQVQFWNAAAERLFGWRADEVLGIPLPVVPADREVEFKQLSERASRGDPLVGVETVRQRRDGSLVEVSLTLTAAANADGSVRAYVDVMRDISERKAIERARADFAAMLTHDIKNPLAVIRGSAEILAENELTAVDADFVGAIQHAGATIERLVADLLMTATIEAGRLQIVSDRVPVADLVSACVDQFRTAAARRQIRLQAARTVHASVVSGDRLQLERALGNLIDNAIKYTPAGGCVSVSTCVRTGRALFQVRDSGPGISEKELPYVFDKYRRVRGTEQIDGAGLGLYIVRSLVDAHGGSVSVRSTVGRGSVFTISLPLDGTDDARAEFLDLQLS